MRTNRSQGTRTTMWIVRDLRLHCGKKVVVSGNPLLFKRKLRDMLKNWNTSLIELKVVCHDKTIVKGRQGEDGETRKSNGRGKKLWYLKVLNLACTQLHPGSLILYIPNQDCRIVDASFTYNVFGTECSRKDAIFWLELTSREHVFKLLMLTGVVGSHKTSPSSEFILHLLRSQGYGVCW